MTLDNAISKATKRKTIAEQLSNRTHLHDDSKMPFGKHKGKRLIEVPVSYWKWFLKQPWCWKESALMEYAELAIEEDA